MEVVMKEAKHFKKGDFIMVDDVPCRVVDVTLSSPGKHGSAKARIVAVGILDNKKRELVKPGSAKVPAPIVDKKEGQVISISGDIVQIMDSETYEMFESNIPEELKDDLKEGATVEYWIIAGVAKVIVGVKS